MTPTVFCESVTPDEILYTRGTCSVFLRGYHAEIFRQMVWKYGKARAVEKFWWLWHKKEGSSD